MRRPLAMRFPWEPLLPTPLSRPSPELLAVLGIKAESWGESPLHVHFKHVYAVIDGKPADPTLTLAQLAAMPSERAQIYAFIDSNIRYRSKRELPGLVRSTLALGADDCVDELPPWKKGT